MTPYFQMSVKRGSSQLMMGAPPDLSSSAVTPQIPGARFFFSFRIAVDISSAVGGVKSTEGSGVALSTSAMMTGSSVGAGLLNCSWKRAIPVLTYNTGTWDLTQADLVRIDTYHRRHFRQVIGVHWPNRISNVALYHRCQCRPISESIITARWRLFGHVLRLPTDAPVQRAIDHYFADTEAATFRGRPRTSLPTTLCSDLRRIGRTLRKPADIEPLRALSREQWRQMERGISA